MRDGPPIESRLVQAAGWRITEDERGPLLQGPRGLVRVDATVAAVFSGSPVTDAGRIVQHTAGRVLRRLGALEREPVDGEPLRPPAPEQGPSVSVVIATYDGRELLAACLRSLADQRYAPLEIVVVDGGSSDGTIEWLRDGFPGVVRRRGAGATRASPPPATSAWRPPRASTCSCSTTTRRSSPTRSASSCASRCGRRAGSPR